MKALLILLPCLLAIALADPDYADLTTGDFGPTGTCRTAPANFVESPIAITDQTCTTYDSFAISLANPTTTATPAAINTATGAFTQTYNGASLTYNNITYTSTQFTFRTQSEHSIPNRFGGQSSAEIQIEMTGNGQTAILAFLVRAFDFSNAANDAYKNAKYNQILNNFDSSAANGWNVGFSTLSGLINDNLGNTAFLNIYTYNGTKTYGDCGAAIWFVYGQEIYADATVINALAAKTKTALGADAGTGNNVNNRPMNVVGGGAGTATTIRLCYTGFFEVVLGYNYGLWFGVTSILLFFIFTLTLGDTPIRDRDYQEDVWTHHPLVSVYKYGNEMHTRKSRVALILAMITVHALFSSVFYRETAPADRTKGSNIILFAVYSMLIDWVISYFLGRILRTYYLAKYQLHKTKDEAWDQKAQNRLFGYYIAIFIVVIVGWAFTVWNMGELHPETVQEPSRFWVASLFVGLALELAVVTPIVCAIAGSVDAVRNWIKSQGFMYDNICHETYMEYLKSD